MATPILFFSKTSYRTNKCTGQRHRIRWWSKFNDETKPRNGRLENALNFSQQNFNNQTEKNPELKTRSIKPSNITHKFPPLSFIPFHCTTSSKSSPLLFFFLKSKKCKREIRYKPTFSRYTISIYHIKSAFNVFKYLLTVTRTRTGRRRRV